MNPITRERTRLLTAALTMLIAGTTFAQGTAPKPAPAGTKPANTPTSVPSPGIAPAGGQAGQPVGQPVGQPGKAIPQVPADLSACALKFESMRHDWGEITDSVPAQHTFKFRNTSDKTITISSVRATCGCTTPQLNKKTYAPGEDGEIPVTFNPQNRKGPQTKNVIVESDDPSCGRLELTLTSNVMPLVYIEPSKIFFNESMRGQGTTQTITVTGREPNFDILNIEGESPMFKATKVKSEPIQEDGRTMTRVTLEVSLVKDAPIGTHNFVYILNTNDPKAAKVNMPVAGTVVGELRATPPGMLVRTFTPSTPFQAQAQIDARSAKAFNIKGVDVEGPADMSLAVDFQSTTQDGKPLFTVTLTGTTPATAGQYRGVITVETDIPGEEPFKFNWIATVRDPNGQIPGGGVTGNNPGRPATAPNKALTPTPGINPGLSPASVPGTSPAPAKPSPTTAPGGSPANAPK